MKLSIIIPAHNEEENIAQAIEGIEECVRIPHELVVVNDHSMDNTARVAQELSGRHSNISLIQNAFAKGFAGAVKTGFLRATGEIVVLIMADLCDDLSTVEKMLEQVYAGADVVCGSRYIKGGRRLGGSKLKGFLSHFAGVSIHLLLGIPTHDIANAFKMYRKKVIEAIDISSRGFELSMELPLKAYYLGFKITEVPTVWRERTRGKSTFKIFRLLPDYSRLYLWALKRKFTKGVKLCQN